MNDNNCCDTEQNPQCTSYSEIFELIGRIGKNLDKFQSKKMKGLNITPSQFSILRHLWNTDQDVKISDLTNVCYCSRSTVSGILNTMEKNGLIVRELKPNQRRISLVKLTEKGRSLEKEASFIEPALNNCCSGFKEEELQTLSNLLIRLNNSLT